jgi:hypothetical protein
MLAKVLVVTDEIERARRLAEMGVTEKPLSEAIRAGHFARTNCTPSHPISFPGIAMWGETVRALRDGLSKERWTRDDPKGFPRIVRPDGRVALAVATGDEATGNPGREPTTKYPKGIVLRRAVNRNLSLEFDEFNREANRQIRLLSETEEKPLSTWVLLHALNENGDVQCELSLPTTINESGHIDRWSVRVLLSPVSPTPIVLPDDEPINPDVEVRKR